jgi:diguanylate cyclase (GGDEF)-like protein/putative nucleotidyltransferase with HDIG domain
MVKLKNPLGILRSRVRACIHRINTGPVAWSIIVGLAILTNIPILFPDSLFYRFFYSFYLGLCLTSLIIAALLRTRRGALLIWGSNSLGALSSFRTGMTISFYILTTLGFLTVALIAGYMRSLAIRLKRAYAELEQAYATIQKQALTDALTGLPNHRALMEQLHKELERASRHHRSLSVLFFDADRFKRVNDTHGHAAGDAVLRQIGQRAESALRGGDTIGRFGGEEFVILLPEAAAEEAKDIAERIRATVAAEPVATLEVEGGLAASISIGLSTYPLDGESEQTLLSQADEAMYLAKRLGRNQVRTAEEARQMNADVELLALLQQAEQRDAAEREGTSVEHLREIYITRSIDSLMGLLQRRDERLRAHAHAVSDFATAIAQAWGISQQDTVRTGMAALLHDIGKIAVPDRILLKSTSLSPQETTLLQEHPVIGAQILEASPLFSDLVPAVRSHHERWDGQGYPDQMTGEEIPLAARIIAVAEAYDAMQRDYPYQRVRSAQQALKELQNKAGSQFDPAVVAVFSTLLAERQKRLGSPPLVV